MFHLMPSQNDQKLTLTMQIIFLQEILQSVQSTQCQDWWISCTLEKISRAWDLKIQKESLLNPRSSAWQILSPSKQQWTSRSPHQLRTRATLIWWWQGSKPQWWMIWSKKCRCLYFLRCKWAKFREKREYLLFIVKRKNSSSKRIHWSALGITTKYWTHQKVTLSLTLV